MARRAAAGLGSHGRVLARTADLCLRRLWLLAVLLISLTLVPAAHADDPVKGVATFSAANGFARLLFKLAEDVEAEVSTAGSIVVIRFKRPVDIPVERLADAVPDYVGMARRDPDGMAIRLSLSRRVTINTMTAAERIFIDFLPDDWAGRPPPLPTEVIRELAERARSCRCRWTTAGLRRDLGRCRRGSGFAAVGGDRGEVMLQGLGRDAQQLARGFARPTREKIDDDRICVIRITPVRDLPDGFTNAPGTPAPKLDSGP